MNLEIFNLFTIFLSQNGINKILKIISAAEIVTILVWLKQSNTTSTKIITMQILLKYQIC